MVKFVKIFIKCFDRYSGLIFLGGVIASKAVNAPAYRCDLGVTIQLQGSISILPLSINLSCINSLSQDRNKPERRMIASIQFITCTVSIKKRCFLRQDESATLENVYSC